MNKSLDVNEVAESMEGRGYEQIKVLSGSTFKDRSTIVVAPTRGTINYKVVQSWQNLLTPMNEKRAFLYAVGDEVGVAYNKLIQYILDNPQLKTWKYLLTLEDDNIVPSDAHIRLLESIEFGPFDAVGGVYFTKGDYNMPMAYGDPAEYARTGVLNFRPRSVNEALEAGQIMEVNGIAMGCTLYRLDLFRNLLAPWFVTVSDVIPEKGPIAFTQDLYFCERAKREGKRFAVDMRVRVGHLDVNTGIVY